MLKELEIRNFQSHDKSRIEFDPNITVIAGSSDVGKSALIRAVRWVTEGRPLGTGIIRKNSTGGCLVSMATENGTVVKLRDSHGTLYTVNDKELDKVGSNVPSDVNDIINLEEINFQFQLEPHFLVLQSGGQVASFINKVLKLDVVGNAIGLCTKRINEKERSRKELLDKKVEYESELKCYENLDQIEKSIKEYTGLDFNFINMEEDIYNLKKIIEGYEVLEESSKEIIDVETLIESVKEVESALEDVEECESQIQELNSIISRVIELDNSLQKSGNVIQLYNKQLNEAVASYEEALREMEICPWCGQEMSESVIEEKKNGFVAKA